MSQPFGDIPLFRELQRILASGQGPVNFEIARQIAGTIATQTADPAPSPDAARRFSDAVREAELLLTGYTRLTLDEPVATKTIGRATWVLAALDGWRWLLESVASRFTSELSGVAGESRESPLGPMEQMMGQIAPLLLGIQIGTVIGHLANDVVARHDPPIPFEDDGALFFVTPNLDRLVDEYDFGAEAFARWLALHEAARQIVLTATPWVNRYFRSLLLALVDAIEIDTSDLERRLIDLQSGGPEALTAGAGLDQMFPVAQTERYQRALADLKSFLAVYDGYAEHAAAAVSSQLLGDTTRIDEGMARHRASPSEGKAMLASVLGIERDRSLETSGKTFCAAVVQLKGISALNIVWAAPDNLPTLPEIKDPFLWIERMLSEEGPAS
ncbi:MAG: zinc-dependent metalloprotease [Actinomycetota bacterium]|nr:zinc-dependent metalloprotease [Actinomycetota bacterium]